MRRTERELTDVEMIDALQDIISIIITGNHQPIREGFERSSRCAQIGYDIEKRLIDLNILEFGPPEGQISLDEKQK